MTTHEILVPSLALAIAGAGVVLLKWEGRRLDRAIARERARHPDRD